MTAAAPGVPWWAIAAAALFCSGHLEQHGFSTSFLSFAQDNIAHSFLETRDSFGDVREKNMRRLENQAPREAESKTVVTTAAPEKAESKTVVTTAAPEKAESKTEVNKLMPKIAFNVSIPCYLMISPCGNVTFGDHDVSLTSMFGDVTIPSSRRQFLKYKNVFSEYTTSVVAIGVLLWALKTCCITSNRQKFIKKTKDTFKGVIEEDEDETDDAPTQEEVDAELQARMSIDSTDFIAPGNIYRLLAVLHPGIIGYSMWGKIAFKAGVCAYMQVYLPFQMIEGIFVHWELNGVKSPLWFLKEGTHFATMFAALASLCTIFQGRCVKNVLDGAQANFYILSHRRKTLDEMTDEEKEKLEKRKAARDTKLRGNGYLAIGSNSVPQPQPPHCLIFYNARFFCGVSVFLNAAMSLELQLVMFLKVATYTGNIQQVAMVALSLYFIFDLDDKVMESDPSLRPMYRRQVLLLSEETERPDESWDRTSPLPQLAKPLWVNRIAGIMVAVSRAITPLGLMGIVLLSWRSLDHHSIIIGGDGFH